MIELGFWRFIALVLVSSAIGGLITLVALPYFPIGWVSGIVAMHHALQGSSDDVRRIDQFAEKHLPSVLKTVERDVHERLNQARKAKGLQPLEWDPQVARISRRHAEDMATRGYFAHESPDGTMPEDRTRQTGLRCGESIVQVLTNRPVDELAFNAVQQWRYSRPHWKAVFWDDVVRGVGAAYDANGGSVYVVSNGCR